ncbi:hypothetical protein [Kribbella sp. NPDC051770]|uniref:hypothetical protein n=1 Tax=Kribbella sp. NPDC051770 TaxID=3155413 RepID=UPI003444E226
MIAADTAGLLRARLLAAGIDLEHPSPDTVLRTWKTFHAFSAVPVEDVLGPDEDGDGLLVQYGVADFGDTSGRHFALDFTRQFIGEGISQLHCTFKYDVVAELEAIAPDNLWSFGMTPSDFAAQVEQMDGFQQVVASKLRPHRLVVGFDADVC